MSGSANQSSVTLAVLPGDGIGREIIPPAVEVLKTVGRRFGIAFAFREAPVGGAAIDATGRPLPPETLAIARASDAVLLGAVGGPKWEGLDYALRPERALLGLREALGLYANLRPAVLAPELIDASPLRRELVEGTDIMVVRELTGGIYFGRPKGIEQTDGQERGVNTEIYTTREIERIARVAFEIARKRRKRVTSIDKANVLESSELWRRIVIGVHKDFQDVELRHMYVDNCAMQLIKDPRQFDVIVTTNMFGDILSDEAAQVVGSIGLLPSASLGDATIGPVIGSAGGGRKGLYEPIHGSAPDIAGRDKANPLATILSVAMLLRYTLGHEPAAAAVEQAVLSVLRAGHRTADIAKPGTKPIGTADMGRLVIEQVEKAGAVHAV
ncbi:MAG TPA: 3-isopropylmalate dehydrogenase [Nitrospiria bacterium]|nr:3-isopropylmalate dehydrogenase [Nitrospiria bacterium]